MANGIDPTLQQALYDFTEDIAANPKMSKKEVLSLYPEFKNDEALLKSAYKYADEYIKTGGKDLQSLNSKFPEFDTQNYSLKKKDVSQPVGKTSSVVSQSPLQSQSGSKLSPQGLSDYGTSLVESATGAAFKTPTTTQQTTPQVKVEIPPKQTKKDISGIPQIPEPSFIESAKIENITPETADENNLILELTKKKAYEQSKSGKLEESNKTAEQLINANPNDTYALHLQSYNNKKLYEKTGDKQYLDKALDNSNTAIALAESNKTINPKLYLDRAELKSLEGDAINTIKDINKYASLTEEQLPTDDFTIGYKKAETEHWNDVAKMHYLKAKTYQNLGDNARAKAEDEKTANAITNYNQADKEYGRRVSNETMKTMSDYLMTSPYTGGALLFGGVAGAISGVEETAEGVKKIKEAINTNISDVENKTGKKLTDLEKIVIGLSTEIGEGTAQTLAGVAHTMMAASTYSSPNMAAFVTGTNIGEIMSPGMTQFVMQPVTSLLMTEGEKQSLEGTKKYGYELLDFVGMALLLKAAGLATAKRNAENTSLSSVLNKEIANKETKLAGEYDVKQYIDLAEKVKNQEQLTQEELGAIEDVVKTIPDDVAGEMITNIKTEQDKLVSQSVLDLMNKSVARNILFGAVNRAVEGKFTEPAKAEIKTEIKVEPKIETNDNQNITGISGEVGKGQEPIKTELNEGTGNKEIATDRDIQAYEQEIDKAIEDGRKPEEIVADEKEFDDNVKTVSDQVKKLELDFTEDDIDHAAALVSNEVPLQEAINHVSEIKNAEPKKNVANTDGSKFKQFEDIVKSSDTLDEAFVKSQNIKDVPVDIANAFRDKYDADNSLTPKEAFAKFYNEVRGQKLSESKPAYDIKIEKAKEQISDATDKIMSKWGVKKSLLPEERTELIDDIKQLISGLTDLTIESAKKLVTEQLKPLFDKLKMSEEDIKSVVDEATTEKKVAEEKPEPKTETKAKTKNEDIIGTGRRFTDKYFEEQGIDIPKEVQSDKVLKQKAIDFADEGDDYIISRIKQRIPMEDYEIVGTGLVLSDLMAKKRILGDKKEVAIAENNAGLAKTIESQTEIISQKIDTIMNSVSMDFQSMSGRAVRAFSFFNKITDAQFTEENIIRGLKAHSKTGTVDIVTQNKIRQLLREYDDLKLEYDKSQENIKKLLSDLDAVKEQLDLDNKNFGSVIKNTKKEKNEKKKVVIKKEISQAKDEFLKAINQISANPFLNPDVYVPLAKMAKGYIKLGALTLEDVITKIYTDINGKDNNISEEDIRVALREGLFEKKERQKKTRTQIQIELVNLKREKSLIEQIQAEEKGIKIEKPSVEKVPETEDVKKLKEKLKGFRDAEKEKEKSERENERERIRKEKEYEKQIKRATTISKKQKIREERENERQRMKEYKMSDEYYNEQYSKKLDKQIELVEKELNGTKESPKEKIIREKSIQNIEKKALLELKKQELKNFVRIEELKNRSFGQKTLDFVNAWQRMAVLSYLGTLGKIAAIMIEAATLKPFYFTGQKISGGIMKGVGKTIGKIGSVLKSEKLKDSGQALADIPRKALVWGEPTGEAFGNYYKEMAKGFSKEHFNKYFSKKTITEKDYIQTEPYIMTIPGRSHGYMKGFISRAETGYAVKNIASHLVNQKNGDVSILSHPETQELISKLAVEHGKYSILMNDNSFVKKFNQMVGRKGIISFLVRTQLPIIKIPTNFVARSLYMKYGVADFLTGDIMQSDRYGVKKGTEFQRRGVFEVMARGTEKLTPENADYLMRSITHGSLGATAFVLGYLNADNVDKDEKTGKTKLFGDETIGGVSVDKLMHHPLLESFLSGAFTANKFKKTDKSWLSSFINADVELVEKAPFFSVLKYGAIPQLFTKLAEDKLTEDKLKHLGTKQITDIVVPGLLKDLGKYIDTQDEKFFGKEQKRKAVNAWDEFIKTIPYWRETLPKSSGFGGSSGGSNKRPTSKKTTTNATKRPTATGIK